MLKAYAVSEVVHYEMSKLVFAENANQAKAIAFRLEEFDHFDYTDLRANRAKFADGHENASEHELRILCIRNGWWYDFGEGRVTSENLDDYIARGLM